MQAVNLSLWRRLLPLVIAALIFLLILPHPWWWLDLSFGVVLTVLMVDEIVKWRAERRDPAR